MALVGLAGAKADEKMVKDAGGFAADVGWARSLRMIARLDDGTSAAFDVERGGDRLPCVPVPSVRTSRR